MFFCCKIVIFANEFNSTRTMKTRIIFIAIAMTLVAMGTDAQEKYYNTRRMMTGNTQFEQALVEQQARDASHRLDKSKRLSVRKYLLNEESQYWSNGRFVCVTAYDPETRLVEFFYKEAFEPTTAMVPTHFIKVVGNKATMKENPHYKVSVEQIGAYTMLVYRNAAGAPVHAYYSITRHQSEDYSWCMTLYNLLAGNYATSGGRNAVFGPRLPFYSGDKYDVDPGIFCYNLSPDYSSIDIEYGEGRVSRGDPSSPRYGKMPGGGGAAAIMGPMEWNIRFTCEGLMARVITDQRFVDHAPALEVDVDNVLTKLQCPWEGIDGKWAFASVMPLTHDLLMLFPAEVLELMRAEIYARHGDTFRSAANQRYFDQQPWYKRSGQRVVLTDVERFNVALIKQVMESKK